MTPRCVMTWVIAFLLAVAMIAWTSVARADIALTADGCGAYAAWSGNIVWARDAGADKKKVRASLQKYLRKSGGAGILELLMRDFESLWSTRSPWDVTTMAVYQICALRGGRYGSET